MEDNRSLIVEGLTEWDPDDWDHLKWEPFEKHIDRFDHPLWKAYKEFGLRGGHGGMDYLVLRAFVDHFQQAGLQGFAQALVKQLGGGGGCC